MLLAGNLKRVALLAAVDFCLRNMRHSPKRCARNLVELCTSAYPDILTESEKNDLYHKLIKTFEHGDTSAAKALIVSTFYLSGD